MFPINLTSIIAVLDDAIKLAALKTYTLEAFEENETVESIKTLADDNGMVVLVGVPLVVLLAIIAISIPICCKKYAKC
jgi:hypothetical protein